MASLKRPAAATVSQPERGVMFTRRIFFGVVTTWFLLEGAKGLWRLWGMQNSGARGFRGAAADDILAVTG